MGGSSYSARIAEDVLFLAGNDDDKSGASELRNKEMQSKFGTSFMFGCRFNETGAYWDLRVLESLETCHVC